MIPSAPQARPETVEELEARKMMLLKEISDLGKTKEELDSVVENHEAKNKKFADLTQAIEDKETVVALLNPEIQKLSEENTKLKNDNSALEVSIEDKTSLLEEINQLKDIIKILQNEERDYRSTFELLKDKSTAEIRNAKDKLKFLSATISSVLAQL